LLFFCIYSAWAAGCNSRVPIHGPPNNFDVLDLTTLDPTYVKLVAQTKNAKIYQISVPNSNTTGSTSTFYVNHLYGSYYDMGFALGKVLDTQVVQFIDSVWTYLEGQVEGSLPNYFPKWLQDLIAEIGLDAALDFTELATYEYTDPRIWQEIQGLADGSGADYSKIVKVHMLAGLTQGKCSMFGMWGDVLAPEYRNSLLQLRALDWDMNGPFRDYSAINVYHPDDGTNHHINIGFLGFVGGLTGISDKQLGISEIGVSYPDATFGSESRIGVPFIFLLRDILRYDVTVDDSISRMANAKRTCDLILGVGDGKLKEFRGFAYSSSVLRVFDDKNLLPYNNTWHPRIPNVVYWGMDWVCPAYNTVLSQQIMKYYGTITPEIAIKYLTAVEMSGDNHLAFYDLVGMKFYVSFAAPRGVTGSSDAYARQFTKFDASSLLSETL